MFNRVIGNLKRWYHRVNRLLLEPISPDAQCKYFEPKSSFNLSLSHKTPLKGFYMVEVNSETPFSRSFSNLRYTSTIAGKSETIDFLLPLGSNKTVKRVVHLSEFARDFRWDLELPLDASRILDFKISKITDSFAKKMLIKKLTANGIDAASLKPIDVFTLYDNYERIFSSKIKSQQEYIDWLKENETPSDLVIDQDVCISIIMPVFNPKLDYLDAAIKSVLSQTYGHWELCIADDCSIDGAVRELIKKHAANEARIKYIFRGKNGNISEASNSALALATGEYIALMDHDDLISIHALNEIALVINSDRPDIIYTDEDKIDSSGKRFDPHFKSDFNYELILSHNYISHFGVYKKTMLEDIGGFRTGFEGSQDYDLLLRCLQEAPPGMVKHIPKILYHWRAVDGSTAQSASQKSYTCLAGLKALKDAVKSSNESWSVELGELPNTYKTNRPIDGSPKVSIIIPTKDQKLLLETCISSVFNKTDYSNYELVVVDNGSVKPETKAYFDDLRSLYGDMKVRILEYPKPFNFSAINNFAVSTCVDSDYVLLLNNDVEVINTDWLSEMVSVAQQSDVGCVGAKLYYSNNQVQHAGVILGIGGVAGHSHKYFKISDNGYFSRLKLRQDLSAVTGACLLVDRNTYLQVGGLDENNLTVAFNDVDFCLKVREAGFRNVWTPFAQLYHHESISRGAEDTPEKVERFNLEVDFMKSKWGELLNNDPYYNPNLSLVYEDFSLR